MRRLPLIAVLASAIVWAATGRCGLAQSQSQAPDSQQTPPDAPKPQKKPTPKPSAADDSSSSSSSAEAPSPAGDNPFPEDVSRKAAQGAAADAQSDSSNSSSNNSSSSDSSAGSSAQGKPSSADDNPFPEDVSRKAAGNAADDSPPAAQKNQLPPGVSSSRSGESSDSNSAPGEGSEGKKPLQVTDQARAKKDNQVGTFYMQTGNFQGAYLRYKDAIASDPTDTEAIFGIAQTARRLKHVDEAERNYLLYLQIVPDGPKAKEARKALDSLLAPK